MPSQTARRGSEAGTHVTFWQNPQYQTAEADRSDGTEPTEPGVDTDAVDATDSASATQAPSEDATESGAVSADSGGPPVDDPDDDIVLVGEVITDRPDDEADPTEEDSEAADPDATEENPDLAAADPDATGQNSALAVKDPAAAAGEPEVAKEYPSPAALDQVSPSVDASEGEPYSQESLSREWHDIQASFVDDPRGAVQMAAEAAEEALTALVAALRERQSTVMSPDPDQDTEQMRSMLLEYRAFCRGIEEAGRRLPQAATTS